VSERSRTTRPRRRSSDIIRIDEELLEDDGLDSGFPPDVQSDLPSTVFTSASAPEETTIDLPAFLEATQSPVPTLPPRRGSTRRPRRAPSDIASRESLPPTSKSGSRSIPPGAKSIPPRTPSLPPRQPSNPPLPPLPSADDNGLEEPVDELLTTMMGESSDVLSPEMFLPQDFADAASEVTSPRLPSLGAGSLGETTDMGALIPAVALGETLQLVHYARRGDTLLITGITPHGRRLTFEQREDRQGWYVVAAGRRRRPTERELGLVIATITQEMEAALVPERQSEVRSAYRLAVTSDQPGLMVGSLEAYRDVLLDESAAYIAGIVDRLAVIAIDYQGFKRFAIRHGHRIGAAFVQALGERLADLFSQDEGVQVFHKTGKSFRLICCDKSKEEIAHLLDRFTTDETRNWIIGRVWGAEKRTHPSEVHFHIGVAKASRADRDSEYSDLAQRLSDDAYRASKLGQLMGHTSIALAKTDERTTVYWWTTDSENELQDLATRMDDGPADVMAELSDYLHELVPADLEGMAVAGDLEALLHKAIARAGFWQGTTAMRIAGDRLIDRVVDEHGDFPDDENTFVAGFDLGDEYYGITLEEDTLYFARGDVNSAGATRVRAGLAAVQRAVGWERPDGGGIVGNFVSAIEHKIPGVPLIERLRAAAQSAFEENDVEEDLHVNDAVDIGGYLLTAEGEPAGPDDVTEGAELLLGLPGRKHKKVSILERRTAFTLRVEIDGEEHAAVIGEGSGGLQVKLRIRSTVASAAICVVKIEAPELRSLLQEIREENHVPDDQPIDVLGFLAHVADILLEDVVKAPAKVELALGARYDARRFVRAFHLEDVREGYPGLFYEAVHMDLLGTQPEPDIDRELIELVGKTMLSSARPRAK